MRKLLLAMLLATALSCVAIRPDAVMAFSAPGNTEFVSNRFKPLFTVRITPPQARPGDVVIVRVTSGEQAQVLGWLNERIIRFALAAAVTPSTTTSNTVYGFTYIALIGLDALMPSGTYSLAITAVGSNGRASRFLQPITVLPQYGITERITLTKALTNTLDPVQNQLEVDEFARIYSDFSEQRLWSGPFIMPVPGRYAAVYGNRRVYNGINFGTYHSGVDIVAGRGTPVKAAATGRIIAVQSYIAHGLTIVIDHGRGVFSGYGHLSKTSVITGQLVRAGDIIGLVGTTGRSQGPHLHFEVAVGGITVDPVYWFRVALPG